VQNDPPRASATAAPAAPAPATSAGTGVDDRNTSFRAVQGGGEMQSGEKLLVEAYAAIWVILFALILLSWRRQRGIDERMTVLSAAIDKARVESEKGRP
jgi:hypothetical protein